jgi:spermidine synthase
MTYQGARVNQQPDRPDRRRFAELDAATTPMGLISLRRRWDPTVEHEVYEIKLDDEYLMSSLFTIAETALARIALADLPDIPLDVAVGGLGLGYTAHAALADPRVRSLLVIEALAPVIDWHQRRLVPLGADLVCDPRCRLVAGDFFALLENPTGLDPDTPRRRFHAILIDIDHSPQHLLHPGHRGFYQPAGLRQLLHHLHPAGVFALWSNQPPDQRFTDALADVFPHSRAEKVSFPNPLQRREAANTIYLARTHATAAGAR